MAITRQQYLLDLLAQLTEQLHNTNLWQSQTPPAQMLASKQPFCCDTLSFEQWLQFVFIPRLSDMITTKQPLPTAIALCPMAEESFKYLGENAAPLINTIADIDEELSGSRQQSYFINGSKMGVSSHDR
jgi:dTDP-4-dehydrorhamnose 3,5-epimerase